MSQTLILIRGESEWNEMNLFTGWEDVDLSEKGHRQARRAGKILLEEGILPDVAYTSFLKRSIHTLNHILEQMDEEYIPVHKSWRLNERHYGALQGLNKHDVAARYGEEQVMLWRRSYDVCPPQLEEDDERNPKRLPAYRFVPQEELPMAESLKMTIERVAPYYETRIRQDLREGKTVIVAAHGNSLRALVKYLDRIPDEMISDVDIARDIPLVYELDDDGRPVSHRYLGDAGMVQEELELARNHWRGIW